MKKTENQYTVNRDANGTYYIMTRTVTNGIAEPWQTKFSTVNLWGMLSTNNELIGKGTIL